MAPARRKGSGRAAAAAALQQWKVGDLVLAKMKGFPAWPAMITDPEKWGYSTSKKKVLVFFFGTKQIAFCNHVDIEAFTEEKKKILLGKRQGKGADFVRAVEEIIDSFDKLSQRGDGEINAVSENFASNSGNLQGSSCRSEPRDLDGSFQPITNQPDDHNALKDTNKDFETCEYSGSPLRVDDNPMRVDDKSSMLDELRQTPLSTVTSSRKRPRDKLAQRNVSEKKLTSIRRSRSSKRVDPTKHRCADLSVDKDSVVDIVLEPIVRHDEYGPENIPHEKFSDNSVCQDDDLVPVSIGTTENGTDKIVESEHGAKSSMKNVSQQLKNDEQLIVNYLNGISKAKTDDGDRIGTVVLKKNRKSCTKRVSHNLASVKSDQHSIQNDNQKDTITSRNSDKNTHETVANSDGDGHLPLVKRARARMRDHVAKDKREETADVKSEKEASANTFDNNNLSSMNERSTSDMCKPELVSTSYDSIQGNEIDVPKVKRFQLTGCIDVEAALPPSKRLHRALEAMSANVAEASNDEIDVPGVHETSPDICCDSSLVGTALPVDDRTIETEPDNQSSGCLEGKKSASEIPYEYSIEVKTSLDANPSRICLETCVISQQEDPNENVVDNEKSSSQNVSLAAGEAIVKSAQPSTSDTYDEKAGASSFQGEASKDVNMSPDVRVVLTDVHVKSPQPSTSDGCDKMDIDVSCQSKEEQISLQVKENGSLSQGDGSMSFPSSVKVTELEQKPGCKGSTSGMNSFPKAKDAVNDSFRVSGRIQGPLSNVVNENTKSSSLIADKSSGLNLKLQTAWELKQIPAPKDLAFSPDSTPMKVLIAAAQAKRLLSRSCSLSDSVADTKASSSFPSPSIYPRENSSDKMNIFQGKSPDPSPRQRCSSQQLSANDLRSGSALHYQQTEANAQLKSFESLLCTLTRAKESIVRATRHAIECARIGIAGEVVQSILLNLEKEPSLHRRIDLFFLVDSITRSCRGSAGEVYPSLFLTVLPRLLSAAAPPGIAACENRRQCLKVLRLWLERRSFPDSIIRHHIRELDSVNDVSFSNGFSRRPSRTERAMDDPIREMEGMLVDEYGSNTSIHFPGLLDSRIGCDDGSDDDKSFEAVTPERDDKVEDNLKTDAPLIVEKHKHILEEVDGELEMEDVAPSTEMESISSYHVRGVIASPSSGGQFDERRPLNFAPPLPEERPPSPPPLPSSPPPPPSVASPSSATLPAVSSTTDFVSLSDYGNTNRIQNCLPQSINSRPDGSSSNVASTESSQYYAPGYRELSNQQLSSAPSLGPSTYGNNLESHPGSDNLSSRSTAPNKAYYLQPPAPVMSNQFSYMQAEPQNQVQSWGDNNPVHFGNDQRTGNSVNDHSPNGSVQHDRCGFAAAGPHGHVNSDKMEAPSNSLSYYGPPSAKSPLPNQGWSHPPRTTSSFQYPVTASRPPATSVPRMAGAPPVYWRPH